MALIGKRHKRVEEEIKRNEGNKRVLNALIVKIGPSYHDRQVDTNTSLRY